MEPLKEFSRVTLSLENTIIPDERLRETPSAKDRVSHELEVDLRIAGCEYIQSAGILLKLPQVAMATAQILFQRFYYSKSFVKYSIYPLAMACIFLAAKIEESCRRLRDVINVFHHLRQKRMGRAVVPMDYMGEQYFQMKNTVIKYERYLLKELGFCVHVEHPHKLIITYLQILGLEGNVDLAQRAWNYMNDGLRTNVFVRFTVKTIACSCVFLAARHLGIPLPRKPSWFLLFNVKQRDIKVICRELLAVYQHRTKPLEELEGRIKAIREELMSQKVVEIKEVNVGSKKNSPQPSTATNSPLLELPTDRKSRSKSPLENKIIARPVVSSLATHTSSRESSHLVSNGSRKRSRTLSPMSPEHKREKRSSLVVPRVGSQSPQTPPSLFSRQKKLPEAYRPAVISSPIRVSSDMGSESGSMSDSPIEGRIQNGLPRAYTSRSRPHQSDPRHRRHQRKHHHRKHRSEKRKHRDSSRSSSRERDRHRHRRRHHRREREDDPLYHMEPHRSNSLPSRHREKDWPRLRKSESYVHR